MIPTGAESDVLEQHSAVMIGVDGDLMKFEHGKGGGSRWAFQSAQTCLNFTTQMVRASRTKSSPLWLKLLLGSGLALGALGLLVALLLPGWLQTYLASENFRQEAAARLGNQLGAQVTLGPIRRADDTLFSPDIRITPAPGAAYRSVLLQEVRLRIDPPAFGRWHWTISHAEAAVLTLDALGSRQTTPPPPPTTASPSAAVPPFWLAWLPSEVRLEPARIRDFTIRWGADETSGGVLERTTVQASFHPDRIDLSGTGGRLRQPGAPPADVRRVEARLADGRLFITDAELSLDTGRIRVEGEVQFQPVTELDFRLQFDGIDLSQLLTPTWQARLTGRIAGQATLVGSLEQNLHLNGHAETEDLVITALPVLDRLALFTSLGEFRRLPVQRASADFLWAPGRLSLQNFHLEAEGLFRVQGTLEVVGDNLSGSLQAGLTSRSLQWIPGAREKVFTGIDGIYLTTPVAVSGTRQEPREDLTPRLVRGAAGSAIEQAGEVTEQLEQLPGKTIDRLFDLLNP